MHPHHLPADSFHTSTTPPPSNIDLDNLNLHLNTSYIPEPACSVSLAALLVLVLVPAPASNHSYTSSTVLLAVTLSDLPPYVAQYRAARTVSVIASGHTRSLLVMSVHTMLLRVCMMVLSTMRNRH